MAAAAAPLALVGAGVQAIGAIQQGNAAKTAGDYNAQVETANAQIARDAATAQEQQKWYETQQLLGKQRTVAGASGVDPNTGSPLQVMSRTAAQGTLDALRLRYQGTVNAINDLDQATLDRYQGAQAQEAGYFKAASTIITGASNYGFQGGFGGGGASGGGPSIGRGLSGNIGPG